MASRARRTVPIRPSGWTERTIARQVEEWSGARNRPVHRSDRAASVLFVELRGWEALHDHLGEVEAKDLLERCVDRACLIAREAGSPQVAVAAEQTRPVISATFEGERHAQQALSVAVSIRDSVEQVQPSPLPGSGLEACAGVNTGYVVEVRMDGDEPASFLAMGTLRSFAVRLQEFAGHGDVFLSDSTRREIGDGAIVRSIGEMRINEWGENAEAFRLLDIVPAPSKTPSQARGFVPGLPIRSVPRRP
jgi:class 3 adenylate cyclase